MGGDLRKNHSQEDIYVRDKLKSSFEVSSVNDLPFPKSSSARDSFAGDQRAPEIESNNNRPDKNRSAPQEILKMSCISEETNNLSQNSQSAPVVHVKSHYLQRTIRVEFDTRLPSLRNSTASTVPQPSASTSKRARPIKSIGDFELIRTIGSGSTARVKMAINIRTNQKAAIKLIDRVKLNDQSRTSKEPLASKERRILREAAILYLLDHPNIVRLYDMIILPDYFCLIFELVEGAQMLDYIISHRRLKERMARKFFRQMVSAVAYCHGNGLVHRDLKIENVLIDREGNARLVDFGLSNFFHPRQHLDTFCGSLYFAAPELLCGKPYVGPEIDVWSLGVILYVLVCGKVPFDDKSLPALHEKIKACRLELPAHLSDECRDLLSQMILADPTKRISIDRLMTHPWTLRSDTRPSMSSMDLGSGILPLSNYPPSSSPSLISQPLTTHLRARRPLDFIDGRIVDYLVEDFRIQYSYDDIITTLRASTEDWSSQYEHPIVSLYFLVKEKLDREGPTGRITAPYPTSTDPGRPRPAFPRSLVEPPEAAVCRKERNNTFDLVSRARCLSITTNAPVMSQIKEDEGGVIFKTPSSGFKTSTEDHSTRRRRFDSLPTDVISPLTIPSDPFRPRRGISLGGDRNDISDDQRKDEPLLSFEPRIRTVYLRGLFSVSTTSTKPINRIVDELLRALHLCQVPWTERNGYLLCGSSELFRENDESTATAAAEQPSEHSPQNFEQPTILTPFGGGFDRGLVFEIHIVRLALLASIHGIQFKRVQGDFSRYKAICSRILECARL